MLFVKITVLLESMSRDDLLVATVPRSLSFPRIILLLLHRHRWYLSLQHERRKHVFDKDRMCGIARVCIPSTYFCCTVERDCTARGNVWREERLKYTINRPEMIRLYARSASIVFLYWRSGPATFPHQPRERVRE